MSLSELCRQRLGSKLYDSFDVFGTLPAMLLLFNDSPADQPICCDLKEVSGLISLLFGGIYYRLDIADKLSLVRVHAIGFIRLGLHIANLRNLL